MSQGSCSSSVKVLLTVDDISTDQLATLPLIGCPACPNHPKVSLGVSGTLANPKALYVICENYNVVDPDTKKRMCKFFKWLHLYGEYLAEHRIPAPVYLRTIEELHSKKVERNVNQEQEHRFPVPNVQIRDLIEEIKRLSKDLDEERCKRGMEQQVNNARFQMLENEAKGRGMGWFSLFLWFLSVCFAMFVGGAMEFGKSN